ncbi:SIMPL domain-containing protein [Shimia sp. SDUM112013]|uniref:SIMPL domain-containing protein n=1 Tax=Shimia sp. SDUM112013 TaxID=3136160 RepID=UPI0032EBC26A
MRIILGFLVYLGCVVAVAAETPQKAGRIVVTGAGRIEVVPDMAVMTLGVSHEAKEARAAISEVADKANDILTRLDTMGVATRDIQTSNLSLHPVRRHSNDGKPPVVEGYRATNTVTVRVRDLSTLGEVLTNVVQDGANEFNGLRFGVQEMDGYHDLARRAAVADAQAKAALYAEAAGVTLGPVVELSEGGGDLPRPVPMMRAEMVADAAMPVAEGEMTVRAQVRMVFAIAE